MGFFCRTIDLKIQNSKVAFSQRISRTFETVSSGSSSTRSPLRLFAKKACSWLMEFCFTVLGTEIGCGSPEEEGLCCRKWSEMNYQMWLQSNQLTYRNIIEKDIDFWLIFDDEFVHSWHKCLLVPKSDAIAQILQNFADENKNSLSRSPRRSCN